MQRKSILINSKGRSLTPNRLECSVCKQRFWMTSKYLDHMSSHKHLLLSCNICNKGFYDQKHLDEHYLTHNEVINTYDCNKCPRKFLQNYQLEQHMKFHLQSDTSSPVEVKKKKVRFNNILQSKNISDEEISSDDSCENSQNICKITTTRSGRVVKNKRVFETEEPEIKSKRRRKEDICENTSVIGDNASVITNENESVISDNASVVTSENTSVIGDNALIVSRVNKAKRVFENEEPDIKSKCQKKEEMCENASVIGDNASVVTSESTLVNGDNASVESSENVSVISDNASIVLRENVSVIGDNASIVLRENSSVIGDKVSIVTREVIGDNSSVVGESASTTCEINLPSKADNVSNNRSSECISNKTCVMVEKIPNKILKKCFEKGNICVPEISEKNSLEIKSDQNKVNCSQVCLPKEINIPHSETAVFQNSVNNVSKIELHQESKSDKRSEVHNLTKDPPSSPIKKVSSTKRITDQEFLYVGSHQDMGKIKKVIEEAKSMSMIKANESISNASASDIGKSSIEHVSNSVSPKMPNVNLVDRSVISCDDSSNPNKPEENAKGNNNGILDKRVVNNFLVVKVTPKLLKKMQKKKSEKSVETSNVLEKTVIDISSSSISCVPSSIQKESRQKTVKLCNNTEIPSKENENLQMKTSERLKETDINLDSANVSCMPLSISSEVSIPVTNQKKDEQNEAVKFNKNTEVISKQNEKSHVKTLEALKDTAIKLDSTNVTCMSSSSSDVSVVNRRKVGEKETINLSKDTEIISDKRESLSLKTSEALKETASNPLVTDISCTTSSVSSKVSVLNRKQTDKLKKASAVICNQNKKLCTASENVKDASIINMDPARKYLSHTPLKILKILVINQTKCERKEAVTLQRNTEINNQNKTSLETKTNVNNCNFIRTYDTEHVTQQNKTTMNKNSQVPENINISNINVSDSKAIYSDIQTSVKECVEQNNSTTNKKISVNSLDDNKNRNIYNTDILKTDVQINKSMIVDSNKILNSETENACNINVKSNSKSCIAKSNESSQSSNKSFLSMPSTQPNDTNDPVIEMSNKLLELYKAKMEEKERKKKEKYEQKKRQRHREETLKKQTNSKFDDSNVISKKSSMQFSADDKRKLDRICHPSHERQDAEDEVESENCWKSVNSNKNLTDKDTFSVSSIVIGEPYTVAWPPESNDSSVIHDSSTHAINFDVQNSDCSKFNSDVDKDSDLAVKSSKSAEEAIQKAQEICSKFVKALKWEECLEYLDKLDDLMFSFNIISKCQFVYDIFRFCRLHVENYDVKFRAIELHKKMLKYLSSN